MERARKKGGKQRPSVGVGVYSTYERTWEHVCMRSFVQFVCHRDKDRGPHFESLRRTVCPEPCVLFIKLALQPGSAVSCHLTEKPAVCQQWNMPRSHMHLRERRAHSGRQYYKCGYLCILTDFSKFTHFVRAGFSGIFSVSTK